MSEPLKSDLETVQQYSSGLSNATHNLAQMNSVGVGSTNHNVNTECFNAYEGVRGCLSSYLEVASRDAANINKIGLHFADVDAKLSKGM